MLQRRRHGESASISSTIWCSSTGWHRPPVTSIGKSVGSRGAATTGRAIHGHITVIPVWSRSSRCPIIAIVGPAAFSSDCNWQALGGPAGTMACRIHTIIYRKVSTDEVRSHSCALTSQDIILKTTIGMVLSIVDTDHTLDASTSDIWFVRWFRPLTSLAKTWRKISKRNEKVWQVGERISISAWENVKETVGTVVTTTSKSIDCSGDRFDSMGLSAEWWILEEAHLLDRYCM